MFQVLIRDGWAHEKDEVTRMAPLINDPCDERLYNCMWIVRITNRWKQLWAVAMDNTDNRHIVPDGKLPFPYGDVRSAKPPYCSRC